MVAMALVHHDDCSAMFCWGLWDARDQSLSPSSLAMGGGPGRGLNSEPKRAGRQQHQVTSNTGKKLGATPHTHRHHEIPPRYRGWPAAHEESPYIYARGTRMFAVAHKNPTMKYTQEHIDITPSKLCNAVSAVASCFSKARKYPGRSRPALPAPRAVCELPLAKSTMPCAYGCWHMAVILPIPSRSRGAQLA